MVRRLIVIALLVSAIYVSGLPGWVGGAFRSTNRPVEATADGGRAVDGQAAGDPAPSSVGEQGHVTGSDEAAAPPRQSYTFLGNQIEDNARQSFRASQQNAEAKLRSDATMASALAEKLASVQSEAAAQFQDVQKRLDIERTRSASLEHDLADAREQMAQTAREAAATDEARQASEAAAKRIETKAQAEQKRVSDLADAQRAAVAQVEDLQKRLEGEQGRSATLEHDLAAARERLARAVNETVEARGALDQSTKDVEAKLQDAQDRAAALADKLVEAQRGDVAQVEDLRKQLDGEKGRSAQFERELASARDQQAQATRDATATAAMRETMDASIKDRETKFHDAQDRAAALSDQLATAERGATATATVEDLRKQLDGERSRSAGLERDLVGARDQQAQATRDTVVTSDARRAIAAATKDSETKLLESQGRAAALADQLAQAKRVGTEQVADLRKQLDGERNRTAGLEHDLDATRAQGKQAALVETEARRVSDLAVKDAQTKLRDAEGRAASLADKLAEAERGPTAQVVDLQKQFDGERSHVIALERDVAGTRAQLTQAISATVESRRTSEAAIKDGETKLRDAQGRAASLADKLAEADRGSTAQVVDLRKQLDGERSRSAGLERDLAGVREQVGRATNDATVTAEARQSFETAAKDGETRLRDAQGRASALADKLAEAERDATARVSDLRKRLDDEQGRSKALEADLGGARERLAQVATETSALSEARRLAEVTAQGNGTQLREERSRAMVLADRLVTAQREAAARVEDLQGKLQGEQRRSTGLERDLAGGREQLARDGSDTAEVRRSLEASVKDAAAKLQVERTRTAALADELATARRDADVKVAALQTQLQGERSRSDKLEHALSASGERFSRFIPDGVVATDVRRASERAPKDDAEKPVVRQASEGKAAGVASDRSTVASTGARVADAQPPVTSTQPADQPKTASETGPTVPRSVSPILPNGVTARIVLRYARNSDEARARATALRLTLQAQGLDVGDPTGSPMGVVTNSVTYFYGEDQESANRIAGVLDASRPIRGRPARGQLPRPGTIEVAIAG